MDEINIQQKQRYDKIYSEKLFLIKQFNNNSELNFEVVGSTKNIYKICISNNKFSCDCYDAKSWAKKYNVLCKHICFTLFKVLKLKNINNICKCKKLNNEEFKYAQSIIKQNNIDEDLISDDLINKYNKLLNSKNNIFSVDINSLNLDDDCPICYETLDGELLKCPQCHNYMHNLCMKKWLQFNKSCVYCRSTIWSKYNESNDDYINLS